MRTLPRNCEDGNKTTGRPGVGPATAESREADSTQSNIAVASGELVSAAEATAAKI